ncbi:sugar phosphate isomerase/epimerase family protein [Saccharopolyspora mangrovi]|uniref:Sugar phosphate isomerase/epimerase n=1 Tax=Saccharopolyspora mangrovi TaxID=3082379 RepID=A0ABU6ALJ6_9PSEU|nr:sugar phosphate isomerase/epimerase [Saccharopolyspora sp. S2-29]MEB3372427.1 sugar phosphate isomerase/epimerase [Saccharopolyspora sp. S2-29]
MNIGLMTDSVAALSTNEALDLAAELEVDTIEFTTGNWSTAPHLNLDALLASETAREELSAAVRDRGLRLSALNASGNQLHPVTGAEQDRVVHDTIRLAGLLGVPTVVLMSGLPAAPGDKTPNWITTCWPPETTEVLEHQWDIAVGYWRQLAAFAQEHEVRLAVEMHANQLVYNAPTLLRLREAVGPVVGANMDPSHLMWMGADPVQSVKALDGAIHHVHAKDTRLESERLGLTSRLETLPFDRVAERAWNYITLGDGHSGGTAFWSEFIAALNASGYAGTLSIEHEDLSRTPVDGVRRSVDLLRAALATEPVA